MPTCGKVLRKIRRSITKDKILEFLREEEDALVVSWFDAAKLLAFVAMIFACMGYFMDFSYIFVHDNTGGFYAAEDITAMEKLYNLYKFLPVIAVLCVVFYLINYSNMKRGD